MLFTDQEDATEFATKFVASLGKQEIILLKGNLGTGKTFLCGEIIRVLTQNPDLIVRSPTFSILQIYELPHNVVYHFDLYRLKSREEVLEIGLEEALARGICLIEWPEIIADMLINIPHHVISLELLKNNQRICRYNKL